MSRTAVVGGGAAGFFLAVNLKEMVPQMQVDIFFFAGEVLDIDGVTGGFNFQAAWTTAYQVACSIANREK